MSLLPQQFLSKCNFKIVPHSPYSPDLASCDMWLFQGYKRSSMAENLTQILMSFQESRNFEVVSKASLLALKSELNDNGTITSHLREGILKNRDLFFAADKLLNFSKIYFYFVFTERFCILGIK